MTLTKEEWDAFLNGVPISHGLHMHMYKEDCIYVRGIHDLNWKNCAVQNLGMIHDYLDSQECKLLVTRMSVSYVD